MIKTRLRRVFLFKIKANYFTLSKIGKTKFNDNWDFAAQTNSYWMEKHREFLILDLLK